MESKQLIAGVDSLELMQGQTSGSQEGGPLLNSRVDALHAKDRRFNPWHF